MRLQAWFLSILTICFLGLTSTAKAQGQSANFGGLGSAGGLSPGAYQSLGTVPAFAGQSNVGTSGRFTHLRDRGRDGRRHGSRFNFQASTFDQANGNSYLYPLAFGAVGSYAYDWYGYPSEEAGTPYGYPGGAQQSDNGNNGNGVAVNTSQSGSQQQNENQNQNENKQESQPQAPRYLTYTKEPNPGLKSGKTEPVDFSSVPAGADVSVDGYFLGPTPTSVRIPIGKHLLTINKWGYRDWIQVLDVLPNKPLAINAKLRQDW